MTCTEILALLKSNASEANREGMARYGINIDRACGVPMPFLRNLSRTLNVDHALAAELWASEVHEARILASLVDDADQVTARQMEEWAHDFDSWDICDQVCNNLFRKTAKAHEKAVKWTGAREELVKRAGFALMASLSVHDRRAPDGIFERYLAIVTREAGDERNFVMKAVNWALRQIGKRNLNLNKRAVEVAREIGELDSKSARWIASDALRELRDPEVLSRLRSRR